MCLIVKKFTGWVTRISGVRFALYILMAFGSVTPSIADCNITQWWTDPCNMQPMLPMMEKFRHGRSVPHQGLVVKQLKMSIFKSKELLKDIEKIYTNGTASVKHHRQNLEWLNATQIVHHLSSFRKFKKKLRKLHPYLQRFAGTLEILSCTPIESQGLFNKVERNRIIHRAKINLRALICEVNEAIPSKFRRPIELNKMHIKLPKKMNLTELYTYDYQILKNIKWFLNQLKNKVLRLKKQRKKNKPHVIRVHNA